LITSGWKYKLILRTNFLGISHTSRLRPCSKTFHPSLFLVLTNIHSFSTSNPLLFTNSIKIWQRLTNSTQFSLLLSSIYLGQKEFLILLAPYRGARKSKMKLSRAHKHNINQLPSGASSLSRRRCFQINHSRVIIYRGVRPEEGKEETPPLFICDVRILARRTNSYFCKLSLDGDAVSLFFRHFYSSWSRKRTDEYA
jgi:hypothetical protein